MKKTLPLKELFCPYFKKILLILIVALTLMITRIQQVQASEDPQQKQNLVTGIVSDENGNPLPGVSIIIEGTTTGTLSDVNGKYFLNLSAPSSVLIFSFVGYNSQKITTDGKAPVNIKMVPSSTNLNEVVVIGYGTQKRKDLTGAVAQVKSEDLLKSKTIGFDQAMQGKMAGVQVTNNSGEPGGNRSIRIRGVGSINSSNEPLYIVDGVPYGNLNSINVDDIDRIDVLKDAAAAAIYGSRASNGVVLVTTKRGQKGLVVSFDAFAGVQSVYKKLDMLNGPQFAKMANENLNNAGLVSNPQWSNPSICPTSDWQSSVFQTAPMQNYNLNISGGGEKLTTMFSFNYLDQDGIIVNSAYKRYTARLNSDYQITDRFKVGLSVNASFEKKANQSTANDFSGALNQALYSQPTVPIQTTVDGYFGLNPDGSVDPAGNRYYGWNGYTFVSRFQDSNSASPIENVYYTRKYYIQNPSTSQQILSSFFAELEVIKGLKIKSVMNLTYGNSFNQYIRPSAPKALDLMGELYNLSAYNESWGQSSTWNWVNTISYNRSFGKHNIGAVAGMDALESNTRYANINTTGNPLGQLSLTASDGATRIANGYPSTGGLVSYFGRLIYDYEGKYLLSATVRRDGSSNFGPENQFGVFPSASIGWRISQENFMKSFEFITDLKIRASYGTVGNQNIPPFKYLSTYSSNGGTIQYTLGSPLAPVVGLYKNNTGDPNIHWEKSTQTDIGLDLSVMKGKLSFTADYYIKDLSDLLGYFPVPAYVGIYGNTVLQNGFSMQNKGFEISGEYRETIGEVNFSIGGNFSTLKNKITKLTDNETGYISQSISVATGAINDGGAETRTYVGGRIGDFYGYVADGVLQTPEEATAYQGIAGLVAGDMKFKDMNGDTLINSADKVKLGNGLPKYLYGFNLKVDYKGFDISAFFNGQAGVEIANMMRFQTHNMRYQNSTGLVNVTTDMLDSWTGAGTSNVLPRNSYTAPTSNRWFSQYSVENGAFLRLNNLQLGYTLKKSILSKIGLSEARFYVSGQNLFTLTKYSGYDPEVGSFNQSVLQTGVDYGRYPVARMLGIGVNCKF